MPTWGADLREMLITAVVVAAVWTVFWLLASVGLLNNNRFETVEADGAWAGLLASIGPAGWGYALVRPKREDDGFRRSGLPGLVILAVPLAAAIQLASMVLWPLVVDTPAEDATVLAGYASDPLASGLAAAYLLALYAWSTTWLICLLRLADGSDGVLWVRAGLLLPVGGIGAWQGIRVFDNPPTETSFLVWSAIAVLGLVLLPVVAAVVTRRTPETVPEHPYGAGRGARTWPRHR